tara:strand:+ start:574 stop:978 length:405 start_codon:yes stop_codon:yes gene_type:complete
MKLMSMKQYGKMTKASLVRKIMKALKKLPKTKLAKLCYELEKKRLPTISTTKLSDIPPIKRRVWAKRNMPRLTIAQASLIPPSRRLPPELEKQRLKLLRKGIKKPRSAKQRINDKRLGRMAKARAKTKRRRRRR